jgi:hypothetical protein
MQIFFGNPSLLLFSVISLFAAIFPVIFGETDEPEVLALNENEDDGYLLDTSNEAPGGRKEIRVLIYNSPPQMNLYEDDCHQHMPLFQKKLRCRYPGYCIEVYLHLKDTIVFN